MQGYRSIKVKEDLYNELINVKDKTNVPISRLLELAFTNFKQSKAYAGLMLFTKTNNKIEK